MLISIHWLKRHIDLPESIEEIERTLTTIGLEVEGINDKAKEYTSLIVAKVLTCEKHPDSDHLQITTVDTGKETLQVVCGAPNVAKGQTVVFAPINTVLPTPDGASFKIKKSKIRGVESFGMICAEDEIGLTDNHDGIMLLDDSIAAGTPFVDLDYYDTILELNVTPNRPDALCHRGVARELAAQFGRDLKKLNISIEESEVPIDSAISLSVQNESGCTRYVGRVLQDIQIKKSPSWLSSLLNSIEIPSINNVVDITNFVLMDIGQPLHSFDMDQLSGNSIEVRRAKKEESITTIDHKKHLLENTDLVICDGQTPACVAGVMGGVESEITEKTKNVFLESAYFKPSIVRKQSKRLALSSDSSYRFERGIDPFMQDEASLYACSWIQKLTDCKILKGAVEYTAAEHPQEAKQVSLRQSRLQKVLGIKPSANEIRKHLSSIGLTEVEASCGAPNQESDHLHFLIPGYRPDLEREIDLIEEVARLIGFDQIPYDMPLIQMKPNELPVQEKLNRKIRYTLSAMGLHECLSLRFTSKKQTEIIFGAPQDSDPRSKPATLLNPLSEDLGVLPTSLLPNLLHYVTQNEKNRPGTVRLFEVGKGQFMRARVNEKDPGFDETPLLGIVVAGHWNTHSLQEKASPISFFDFKGLLQSLFKRLGLQILFKEVQNKELFMHPAQQVELYADQIKLGTAGFLHPAVMEKLDISYTTAIAEIDLSQVEQVMQKAVTFKAYSKQVPSSRDISIEVDEQMLHQNIVERIQSYRPKNLASIRLKSIYQGDKIEKGKKNMVYSLVYQSMDRTLTDEEINKVHNKLRDKLVANGDIVLR